MLAPPSCYWGMPAPPGSLSPARRRRGLEALKDLQEARALSGQALRACLPLRQVHAWLYAESIGKCPTSGLQGTSAGRRSSLPSLWGQVLCCHTSGAQLARMSGNWVATTPGGHLLGVRHCHQC